MAKKKKNRKIEKLVEVSFKLPIIVDEIENDVEEENLTAIDECLSIVNKFIKNGGNIWELPGLGMEAGDISKPRSYAMALTYESGRKFVKEHNN